MLPTRTLGKTNLQVTQLGYGSMGLRGPKTWGVRVVDEADAEAFLNRVLDAGINFIDTAPDYGIAEQRIGRYLSARRDEYFLATKCGCVYTQHDDHLEIDHQWNADVIRGNLETSLERMQTDYVDLLQFHGGDAETLQREGLIDLLEDFRRQGLVRFIGVSSKLPNVDGLIELGVFDSFQMPYSCLAPEHSDAMQRAADSGAGVIVRGGIAHGGPDAEIERPALNEVWQRAALDELLPEGMTRAVFLLRATLSHPACDTTIVGTCNPEHLKENLTAAEAGPLPEELLAELAARVQAVA
ncbi:aldo/keto reductase [Roseimaritima ulvae]|uniref:General stress protein 69 n=1 Tax=Roseimaritima ulvae TaxID=980254 RepID=A0A5B9QZF9_9BACT|nr:aldo/keto reductase [Roseimaritima ulvae]QEG42566.1 General stress protein 69 [Roseimaritima ulvae]